MLLELLRSRAEVHAAIRGLSEQQAALPIGEGKWSPREVVLHLVARDRVRLREMEGALRGARASWADFTDEEMSRANAADIDPLRHLSWENAVQLLHSIRRELLDAIESLPEDPAEVWSPEHPFGWMLDALPRHDRHHAEAIRRWRKERGA